MKRIVGIVLAVLLIGGVAAAVVAGREQDAKDPSTATTTVRGVIGSEKRDFFHDPDVVRALADKGLAVQAETAGSWAMEDRNLDGYDFAFPSSSSPAKPLLAKSKVGGEPVPPFYSPLVVVAHRAAAQVLAGNGLATLRGEHSGILRMRPYLDAVRGDRTWQQLKGAGASPELSGTLFVSSTDPVTSNSGALYLATASYVAAGKVATSEADIEATAPLMRKLIRPQGAQKSSSDGPFRDFVSGVGNPLVLVYESQVASLLMDKQPAEDLVVLYPDTDVFSDHTVVPLTEEGKRLGTLLAEDPELRRLAVRHGFRPQGDTGEFLAATRPYSAYLIQDLRGSVHQAAVPSSGILHRIARSATSEGD